jgi:ankyrin repeat protein
MNVLLIFVLTIDCGREFEPESGDSDAVLASTTNDPSNASRNQSHALPGFWGFSDPLLGHILTHSIAQKSFIEETVQFYQNLPSGLPPLPSDLGDDLSPEDVLKQVISKTSQLVKHLRGTSDADLLLLSRSSSGISYGYWAGIGSLCDPQLAFKWLLRATQCGDCTASELTALLFDSCTWLNASHIPIRLLLVLGSLGASRPCQQLLKLKAPNLFRNVYFITEWSGSDELPDPTTYGLFYSKLLANIIDKFQGQHCNMVIEPSTDSLVDSHMLQYITIVPSYESPSVRDGLRQLVKCAKILESSQKPGVSPGHVIDPNWRSDDGRTLLHLLSAFEDSTAAALVPHLVCAGVQLGATCKLEGTMLLQGSALINSNSYDDWTALDLTIQNNQPRTFEALYQLYLINDEPLIHFLSMMHLTAQHCQRSMLSTLLSSGLKAPLLRLSSGNTIKLRDRDISACLHDMVTAFASEKAVLKRRWIQGPRFSEAKQESLDLLLKSGADPLWRQEEDDDDGGDRPSTLDICLCGGDTTALHAILDHAERESIDYFKDLSHCTDADDYNGLQKAMLKMMPSMPCLDILIQRFPLLIESENLKGHRALHSTAYANHAEAARKLLKAGADVHARTKEGSTALYLALLFGALEVTDTIYDFCTESQRDELFYAHKRTGWTVFGSLVKQWDKTSTITIRALRWLVEKGRHTFFSDAEKQIPVWYWRLNSPPRTHEQDARLDEELLYFLFDLFPDKLNILEGRGGRSPLHLACLYGNLQAVKILLAPGRKVDVNLTIGLPGTDVRLPSGGNPILGWTALDCCMHKRKTGRVPESFGDSALLIHRWKQDVESITQLIIRAGGRCSQPNSFSAFEADLLRDSMAGLRWTSFVNTVHIKGKIFLTSARTFR